MSAASDALKFTPISSIAKLVTDARATFDSGRSRPLSWRLQQIRAIERLCSENKDAVVKALQADLHRPELECVMAELLTVISEARHAISHLDDWMQPTAVPTPPVLLPGSSYTKPDPLGVVCIIAPWNFPIQLILGPLIACVAAGNTAVIKPSEVSSNCALLIQELIQKYLDTDAIKVVQGAVAETSELLKQRFDHIIYTGNGDVAKVVMKAASEHLTPVTLELGGKSPAIVAEDADIELTAKRLVLAKCLNAGQVCIAPDYLLVHRKVADQLVDRMIATIRTFYGDDMKASNSFGRIINSRHYERVSKLLQTAGGKVVYGGAGDPASNYMELTLIRDPTPTSPIMQQEIFGPLLPIVTVDSVDEAVKYVTERPKPLALYVFTSSSRISTRVLDETTSGGAVINDAIVHNAVCDLPFGGVGPSGMGAYHGKFGFDAFSHRKAVFHQASLVDTGRLRYPPYSAGQLRTLEWVFNAAPALPRISFKDLAILGLGVAVTFLAYKLNLANKA